MSAENQREETEGNSSSTEYWPGSGSSVASTLSPASDASDEILWDGLNATLGDAESVHLPQPESHAELNTEFIGYVEQFLLLNLFSLSPALLWNLYIQLSMYFSMIANMAEIPCVVEVPPMEGDVNEPTEGELEPPILSREQ